MKNGYQGDMSVQPVFYNKYYIKNNTILKVLFDICYTVYILIFQRNPKGKN